MRKAVPAVARKNVESKQKICTCRSPVEILGTNLFLDTDGNWK